MRPGGTKPLAERIVLVTGAAKRLGRAIVLDLAAQGASVVVHYRSSDHEARACASAVRALGPQAWTIQADLADPEQSRTLLQRAAEECGPVDVLVNSASIFPESSLMDFTQQELDVSLRVNALAPLDLCRAFANRNREGCIVNLLDTRVLDHDPKHAAYHLSKRMLFTLTRMLAMELAPMVRVNAVAPGLVLPPPGQDETYLEKLIRTNPMRTHGGPEDVARAVTFLVASPFVTGQVVFVDGGRHMLGGLYGC